MCEKVGLMIVYDDNDSLRREEILGVTRFEGAAIGTKGGGVKQQASTISSSCKKHLTLCTKTGVNSVSLPGFLNTDKSSQN